MGMKGRGIGALVALAVAVPAASGEARGASSRIVTASVGTSIVSARIAPGFLGLSLEFQAVRAYTGTDPAAQPAQLLLWLETLEIEVGSEPAAIDLDARRELEGRHRGKVHDQDRRVVVVEAGPFAKRQRPRHLSSQLGDEPVVEAARIAARGYDLHAVISQLRVIGQQRFRLASREWLARPVRLAVDQSPPAVAFQSGVGDEAGLEALAGHGFDRIAPELRDPALHAERLPAPVQRSPVRITA